jgi:DNA-binding NarL/FixJ family response regulator
VTIPIHALVLEDDVGFVRFLEAGFRSMEFLDVTFDTTGWKNEGLQLLEVRAYDVILLDLGLRDSLPGIDVAVEIIKAAPNTPVIILSGRQDIGIAKQAMRAGAQNFVSKSEKKVRNPDGSTRFVNEALDPEHLERVMLYAVERKRIENQAKSMLLEASNGFSSGAPEAMHGHLFDPYLKQLDSAVGAVETYLSKANSGIYEEAQKILDTEGFYLAMREIRSLLLLGKDRKTLPAPSSALKALRAEAKSDPDIDTPAAAYAMISDVALKFDEDCWGDISDELEGA